MLAHIKYNSITDSSIDVLIMAVIINRSGSTRFFKSCQWIQVTCDYLFDLNFRSWLKHLSIYLSNIISTSMEILQVLFGESEMILFLMKILLNLFSRGIM